MKLDEIVEHMGNYNFTKFHQNQMKNKKVLLTAHFSVQNFKVSVDLWKLYIVYLLQNCAIFFNDMKRRQFFHESLKDFLKTL